MKIVYSPAAIDTDIKLIRILDGRTEYLRELFFYSIE